MQTESGMYCARLEMECAMEHTECGIYAECAMYGIYAEFAMYYIIALLYSYCAR